MTRRELTDMIDLAERLIAAGEPGVLSTLFSSSGSTYRSVGSMMVSGPPPFFAGGISGGCLEPHVARVGRSLTRDTAAAILSFDTDPEHADGVAPALGCGGTIEVLVERLEPPHIDFLHSFRAATASDERSTHVCSVRLHEDRVIGVERAWVDTWLSPIDRPSHRHMVQRVAPMTRLVVFGAGDDVQPLVTIARGLDWHVAVIDRRARLSTPDRFAEADQTIGADWATAVEQIQFTPRTAVVLMTHSLTDDAEILPLIQDKAMFYVGSLGPEHRRRNLIDQTQQAAMLSKSFIDRLRGPIGLKLRDRTAMGIAISISAEILAELNGRTRTSPLPLRPRDRRIVVHA